MANSLGGIKIKANVRQRNIIIIYNINSIN